MSLNADILRLSHSAQITLFELDLSTIDPMLTVPQRYCGDKTLAGGMVVWRGNAYTGLAIEGTGYETRSQGQQATPTLKIANIGGMLSTYLKQYDDLYGAVVTRIRTLAKYLDGMPGADPTAEQPRDYYRIERKVSENKIFIELELASVLESDGVRLPKRIITTTCQWEYRGPECNYFGPPVATITDTPTSNPALDRCGKRRCSCSLRDNLENYGGLPGVALVS